MTDDTTNAGERIRPDANRPFPPGNSANPGGRPGNAISVTELAREWMPQAIATLAAIMQNEDAPSAARVFAATALLDRARGRPTATVPAAPMERIPSALDRDALDKLTDEQLEAMIANGQSPLERDALDKLTDEQLAAILAERRAAEDT